MNFKEIERVVGMIQTQIFRNSNAYAAGMIRSHFRGSGLQFREHQVYVPGDDVRFIDWKLSAKSPNVYIKTFEEERNVELFVFLDLSHTLFYGYNDVSKFQAIIEILALLYLLADETNDVVRVVIWGKKTMGLPPKKGKEGITLLISVLEKLGLVNQDGSVVLRHKGEINKISEISKISQLKSVLAKKKEVLYLGDFSLLENKENWLKILDKKNAHFFRIYSPIDKYVKNPFFYKIRSPLNGKSLLGELRASDNSPLFLKQKFKEIGVHERYLEKFVKELV